MNKNLFRQRFAEQNNLRSKDRLAAWAFWRQSKPTIINDPLLPLASRADQIVQTAVDFQNIICPGLSMQPIDILRECPDPLETRFHFGNDLMGPIACCSSGGLLNLPEILPRQLRPAAEHLARQNVFNREALLGMLVVVKAANATIGRQTRIGGYSRSSNEQQTAAANEDIDDASDSVFGGLWIHDSHQHPNCNSPRAGEQAPTDGENEVLVTVYAQSGRIDKTAFCEESP